MNSLASGLPFHADLPPLRADEGGVARIGNSRISLDLIVEQYENGVTPEGMVRAYDTLALADVHAVICTRRTAVRKTGPSKFACGFSAGMWDNLAGLVEPFMESASRSQRLADMPGEAAVLLSASGQW
jgi:uncharacterized protein (DUF433 family)